MHARRVTVVDRLPESEIEGHVPGREHMTQRLAGRLPRPRPHLRRHRRRDLHRPTAVSTRQRMLVRNLQNDRKETRSRRRFE